MYEHHLDTVEHLHVLHITLQREDIDDAERLRLAREQVAQAIREDDEWMVAEGYVLA